MHDDRTGLCLMMASAVVLVGCSMRAADKPHQFAPSKEECVRELAEVRQLRGDLARLGVAAFVSNAATPRTAPHIHSQCWVDWLPGVDVRKKAYEQEKREFGRAFVGELEKCAMRQRNMWDYDELVQECDRMLRTADWLKTSKGYGNYLLAHWAENLVLNMVGKMSICSEMNTNTVNGLLARLSDYEADLQFRLSVLNEEAPDEFSAPMIINPDSGFNALMRQWGKRRKATVEHYGPMGVMRKSWRDASPDERSYAFYLDDSCSGERTAREIWDRKQHSIFCSLSPEFHRMKAIRNILLYRELVGRLQLPNAAELADAEAGRKYEKSVAGKWTFDMFRKYGPNCTGWWTLMICGNNFVDQWTGAFYRRNIDTEKALAL